MPTRRMPKSGRFPVAISLGGGRGGPITGAMRSLKQRSRLAWLTALPTAASSSGWLVMARRQRLAS